jgi:hypothetical protein
MRRWAVYFTVDPPTARTRHLLDPAAPVFQDDSGEWWAERVAERFWLRRSAEARIREFVAWRADLPLTLHAAELRDAGLDVPEGWTPRWKADRANLSGWYDPHPKRR